MTRRHWHLDTTRIDRTIDRILCEAAEAHGTNVSRLLYPKDGGRNRENCLARHWVAEAMRATFVRADDPQTGRRVLFIRDSLCDDMPPASWPDIARLLNVTHGALLHWKAHAKEYKVATR
jgi:hypothetical protein